MLNFDEDRFVRIQSGAVAFADEARGLARAWRAAGAERLFFMGTGGVQLLAQPAIELARRLTTFPVDGGYPAQVVRAPPAGLDSKAVVVIPSLSGTTRESVELLAFLKARGVRTLALTGHGESPLGQGADQAFVNFAQDDTSSESFYLQTLILVLALLAERGEFEGYEEVAGELKRLPRALVGVKAAFEDEAARLADEMRDEAWHIFTGAGSVWPQAHYYGMCILEEMQWIRTRPVHAADFFHGTLELVEPGASVFVLKGEDPLRPLSDRVEAFARRYTDKVRVLDAADAALPGVSPRVRALVSPVVLASRLERLSAHLEVLRDHPLTTRRYYRRVDY